MPFKLNPITGKLDLVLDPGSISIADLGTKDHDLLDGLGDDDHTQYALLAGRAGGQTLIGSTLTTENLVLQDNAIDGNFLTLTQTGLIPGANAALNLGEDSTPLRWKTLFLENDGGDVIDCRRTVTGGGPTNYTIQAGGGSVGGDQNQGGTFTFKMSDVGPSLGTSVNQLIFDVGRPDIFASGTTNDLIFQSFNGISAYGFVVAFGGWNDSQYGLELRRLSGSETSGKTLIFDNQIPNSDFRRSIDFRINTVNKLSIENNGTLLIGSGAIPAYTVNASTLNYGGVLNIDVWTMSGRTTNFNAAFQLVANGTSPNSAISCSNGPGATAEMSVIGTTAYFACYRGFGGSSTPDTLIIGDSTGGAGLGNPNALNTIQFNFRNAEEMRIERDLITFNNGAVDTQLDWETSGELGLQVATNDILRLSATQAIVYQDLVIPSDTKKAYLGASLDMSIEYGGTNALIDTSLQNASDLHIDCGTDKTVELDETVWEDLRVAAQNTKINPSKSEPAFVSWKDGLFLFRFLPGNDDDESVHFTVQLSHTYKEGTDIYPHIHWTPDNTDTGDVKWELEYSWQNVNGTFPASTSITVLDAADGTIDKHQVSSFAAISGTGKQISSMLVCRLTRLGDDIEDDFTGNAFFLEFDLHFEVNTMGSRQEFIK